MSTQTETGIETRLFVGGAFVDAEGGGTFENRDPFTDEVVSEGAAGGRGDARRAPPAAGAAGVTTRPGASACPRPRPGGRRARPAGPQPLRPPSGRRRRPPSGRASFSRRRS